MLGLRHIHLRHLQSARNHAVSCVSGATEGSSRAKSLAVSVTSVPTTRVVEAETEVLYTATISSPIAPMHCEPGIASQMVSKQLAGHSVERKARGDLSDAAGTFRDDDEVDADENQEDHEADGVVAADHERAERMNDLAGLAMRQDQPRARYVEREAE